MERAGRFVLSQYFSQRLGAHYPGAPGEDVGGNGSDAELARLLLTGPAPAGISARSQRLQESDRRPAGRLMAESESMLRVPWVLKDLDAGQPRYLSSPR